MTGFESATPYSRIRCVTGLRYILISHDKQQSRKALRNIYCKSPRYWFLHHLRTYKIRFDAMVETLSGRLCTYLKTLSSRQREGIKRLWGDQKYAPPLSHKREFSCRTISKTELNKLDSRSLNCKHLILLASRGRFKLPLFWSIGIWAISW